MRLFRITISGMTANSGKLAIRMKVLADDLIGASEIAESQAMSVGKAVGGEFKIWIYNWWFFPILFVWMTFREEEIGVER